MSFNGEEGHLAEQYDAILIGAGQANNPLATTLAQAGWEVAIIEREHVGGTCVNEGCTPSKTMIASARVAHMARRADDYGVRIGPIGVDMTRVRERKRNRVETSRKANRRCLEEADGVDLLMGEGRFTDANSVEVLMNDGSTRSLTAERRWLGIRGMTSAWRRCP
jgi:pyruvate/2-oxoglutarate dehydrogenase complex dihydrolipoamide dehydrogenase (E3) component